jgi:hypothetical protein
MRVPVRAATVGALALVAGAMTFSTSASAQSATTRVLSYDGAQVTVPASWPVYNLADDPTQCVRFDRHAVYLGHPGANQNCPAHLVGRTTALLVEPYDAKAQVVPVGVDNGATQAVTSNGKALVTASYGSGGPQSAAALLKPIPTTSVAPKQKVAATSSTTAAGTATPAVVTPDALTGAGYGFDTCAAPSTDDMQAWSTSTALYRSIGIYVGGVNRSCPDGNLSATWVKTVRSYGYSFMPLYVGRQAPCAGFNASISTNPTLATTNGHDAAVDAIKDMQKFGFGAHSVVYLDMEAYDSTDATCSRSVLRFIDEWVHRLHLSGYVAGVYIHTANTVDLIKAHSTAGFYLPDAVWITNWNNKASVYGDPVLPDNYWAPHKRLHQYRGPHPQVYNGVSMSIDTDYLDGPVD